MHTDSNDMCFQFTACGIIMSLNHASIGVGCGVVVVAVHLQKRFVVIMFFILGTVAPNHSNGPNDNNKGPE